MKTLFKCIEAKMNRLRGRLNLSVNKTPVDFSFQEDEEDSETDTDTEEEENGESEEDVLSAERLEEEAEDPVVLN